MRSRRASAIACHGAEADRMAAVMNAGAEAEVRDIDATAQRYAQQLLHELAIEPLRPLCAPRLHPAQAWAQSGLMQLSGMHEGPALLLPLALASAADGVLAALASLSASTALDGLSGRFLLAERAACTGDQRRGAVSANGACRLLDAADGGFALNLPRDDDHALLPAWLQDERLAGDALDATRLQQHLRERSVEHWVSRARLLGLAAAPAWRGTVPDARVPDCAPLRWQATAPRLRAPAQAMRVPRVLDLSSLWAGPLCAQLLQMLGADVVKLESRQRPDGARQGPPAFFDLLHAGKRSVAIDWHDPQDQAQLRALLQRADIVIESARPRALQQIGIDVPALLQARPQLSWISITGYGRDEPQAQWIAYGDDAGVAAGLSARLVQCTGVAAFAGDAIADPLTGLHAALAAWAGWLRAVASGQGGGLISLPLAAVVARAAGFEAPGGPQALRARHAQWQQQLQANGIAAAAPRARPAATAARALGADTAAVLDEWNGAC